MLAWGVQCDDLFEYANGRSQGCGMQRDDLFEYANGISVSIKYMNPF